MNCTNCGAPVAPGQYCQACGTPAPQGPPSQGPSAGDEPNANPGTYGPTAYGQPGYPAPGYPAAPYPQGQQGPYGQTGYSQTGYGQAGYSQPGYGPPGYTQPYPSGGFSPYPPAPKNNGLAIASLVCSILGLFCGVGGILGIIFGFVARGQIKRSAGAQQGAGLALAGIIVGFVLLGLWAAWLAVIIAVSGNNN